MSDEPKTRRRAPGMSAEQRREMIVKAAIPLIGEYGAAVTTSKIARAAGIGEATIFRVFADKEELLDACVAEAMRPDHVMRELGGIPLGQPLADRLAEAFEALRAHMDRIGAVVGTLHSTGHGRREPREPREARGVGREESMARVRAAVAELLEPDAAALRLPVEQVAALFAALPFVTLREGDQPRLSTRELVDVFLHGAAS
jgi:AcrR family transcriptional regulator